MTRLPRLIVIGLMAVIGAVIAIGAPAPSRTPPQRNHVQPAAPGAVRSAAWSRLSLSELASGELSAYLATYKVQRVPFDSTLATIRTCLRRPEDAIEECLGQGARNQACETSVPQCASAAKEAWQLYISHYLDLLRAKHLPTAPDGSQAAWQAYVDAECGFEEDIYLESEPEIRSTVDTTCRAEKAMTRALELRDSLINA